MNKQITLRNLGLKDYKDTWDYQEQLFKEILDLKIRNRREDLELETPNYLLFVEHPHVYTLGKSGDFENLLVTEDYLKEIDATFYKINRGGDITYHGPGQIVGYPILDLENFKRYDFLINLLSQSNFREMVELYKRFYPLFQEAYIDLGYPQRYFNDRVIEVIDHLVETPEIEETIVLIRPHVLYEFADPNLEKLSSGQKILIRMGNENALKAKKFLGELRKLLISNSD